jgi:hypothetical protein
VVDRRVHYIHDASGVVKASQLLENNVSRLTATETREIAQAVITATQSLSGVKRYALHTKLSAAVALYGSSELAAIAPMVLEDRANFAEKDCLRFLGADSRKDLATGYRACKEAVSSATTPEDVSSLLRAVVQLDEATGYVGNAYRDLCVPIGVEDPLKKMSTTVIHDPGFVHDDVGIQLREEHIDALEFLPLPSKLAAALGEDTTKALRFLNDSVKLRGMPHIIG